MKILFQKNALLLAWIMSVMAMVGSLFFSLIMKLPPCDLCWYQRIAFYPLIVILAVGIIKKDANSIISALILSVLGWGIALYHNLLYYNIIPEAAAPCSAGVSCTTKYVEWFGFLTIPLLSLLAFTAVVVCLLVAKKYSEKVS